jgi:hypothetical protein
MTPNIRRSILLLLVVVALFTGVGQWFAQLIPAEVNIVKW